MVGDIAVHGKVHTEVRKARLPFFSILLQAFQFLPFLIGSEGRSGNTSGCRTACDFSQFFIEADFVVSIAYLVMSKPADSAIFTSYHLVLIVDVACPDELFGAGSRRRRYLKFTFIV